MTQGVYENLAGRVFGRWTVLNMLPSQSAKHKRSFWRVQCACGNYGTILGQNLKRGKNLGCGCVHHNRIRPFESLFHTIFNLANRRNIPVNLTYEEYLEFTRTTECHYCKEVILWTPFNKLNGHHLDRKDNALGYSKDNCVVCCGTCNRVKSDVFTYEQFLVIGDLIRSWRR